MRKKTKNDSNKLLLLRIRYTTFITSILKGYIINNLITNSHGKRQKANPWEIKAE